jgi:hypothetical protein
MTGIGDLLPTSVITWTPQGVTLSGAGAGQGAVITGRNGQSYVWETPAQSIAANTSGAQYYQPSPGVFVAVAPGTPLFQQK